MRKSSWTLVGCTLGAILLICFWQFSLVDAYQRRGGEQRGGEFGERGGRGGQLPAGGAGERGGRGGPGLPGQRGGPDGGQGGRGPGTFPTRPGQGDPPGQGGAQPANITVNHNHFYGGDNRAAYVAPGGAGAPAGYGAAPGYGGYGYSDGAAYNSYGPGTAAINLAQAQNQSIQNHNYSVQSYYANQELHDQYVTAHREPKLTEEQQEKLANEMSPGRLSPVQIDRTTNIINWPQMLRGSSFTDDRTKIDHLFDERTASDSGIESQNYVEINTACKDMKQTLVKMLRDDPNLPAVSFCAMEHFIKSVAYEASFSVHAATP